MKKLTLTTKMKTTTSKTIGRLALEAMLVEVSVTPKPGLVDRENSGAHRDMGFFTFLKSAAGLRNAFDQFARAGFRAGRKCLTPPGLFPELRRIGLTAERDMFTATGGINTHKGEIFSLGVVSGAAGYLAGIGEGLTAEGVLSLAGVVCHGLCERDFAQTKTKAPDSLTKGERAYLDYGITGIRGEAESGYPIVRKTALPHLVKYLTITASMNDALALTLLHIIAENFDTNILSRHNISTLREVMALAKKLIDSGAGLQELRELDAEFRARNISPSGSADLLAVTYFVYSLTHSSPNS